MISPFHWQHLPNTMMMAMIPTRGVIYQTDRKGVLELLYQCRAKFHWDIVRNCSGNDIGSTNFTLYVTHLCKNGAHEQWCAIFRPRVSYISLIRRECFKWLCTLLGWYNDNNIRIMINYCWGLGLDFFLLLWGCAKIPLNVVAYFFSVQLPR